jgi:hypothetical protein
MFDAVQIPDPQSPVLSAEMSENTARLPILTDISDRHAHGLARHDLRVLRDRCRRASDGAFRTFNESSGITTAKGARRLVAKVDRSYAGTTWARKVRSDRQGTYAGWLTPVVDQDNIAVCCVSLRVYANSPARLRQWPWLVVPKHAIARGHQRLRDSDWRAVQSELRAAALQAALVQVLSMAIGLKQFAIPALHGLVIGDVGEHCLHGRTFIVPPYSRRWGDVFDAWVRFQEHLPAAGARAIEAIALDHELPELEATCEALARELEPFEFLREAYAPGRDRVGDLWESAREQRDRMG